MMFGSWDMGQDKQNFLSFWNIFCPFTPWKRGKSKFWKNETKNARGHYHFTHVYHKWKSYNVWFLRYGARQTIFFLVLGHFLSFYPSNNPEKQNFGKMKNSAWGYHYFTQVYQKSWSYAILFLRYGTQQLELLFFILVYFLFFYPLTARKIKIEKKWKKLRYHHFTHVSEIWCATDGRTEGQTDRWWHIQSDIYRWVPHLMKSISSTIF